MKHFWRPKIKSLKLIELEISFQRAKIYRLAKCFKLFPLLLEESLSEKIFQGKS